jgi:hypothetical protein
VKPRHPEVLRDVFYHLNGGQGNAFPRQSQPGLLNGNIRRPMGDALDGDEVGERGKLSGPSDC